ncbi:hypothetical protein B0H10DRAFT_1982710 [Mycena sp. CBHHK59/15]|nr:hypothetical protein B0H10DRAFT_1982710 [Mycena sp. CBHHK59/15]
MSSFRPTCASPPSKLASLTDSLLHSTISADLSRSSAVSIRELTGLSPEDVDLLEAIISRAGPSATTFPAVFSAYNAVLKERGLDPSEVVFYAKLLKLGTLKGRNWGDKWSAVKLQQGYGGNYRSSHTPSRSNDPLRPRNAPTCPITRVDIPPRASRHADSFTLHSHENEGAIIDSEDEEQVDANVPQYHLLTRPTARRPASPLHSEASSVNLDAKKYPLLAPPTRSRPMPPLRPQVWDTETSDATEYHAAPSTTPPSYRAALREPLPVKKQILNQTGRSVIRPTSTSLTTARQLVAQARERKGSVINEDDAWNKIKMLQDERHADRFRQDRLLERCWEVWKQGFQWIITTNQQIGEARDNLIVRLCVQRWRTRTAASREFAGRVDALANNRLLRVALHVWRAKTKEREQNRWRISMRSNMKIIRDKRELKLMKDALAKWRQSYRSHLADQHYTGSLVHRYYGRWKKRLARLDHFDDIADQLSQAVESGALERCWHHWKHETQLRIAARVVTENIGLRVKTEVMDVWRRQMRDNHIADAYHDFILKKKLMKSWKAARDRIRAMEYRASQHAVMQDRVLLRAVYGVLRARQQGRRLKRITAARRLKEVWVVWKTRLRQQNDLQDIAHAFSLRLDSPLARTSLQKWYQVHSSHKNSQSFAVFHYSDALRRRILLAWRIRLRQKHKLMSKARSVDKFLVTRRAWGIMRTRFAERRREHSLKDLELRTTQKTFYRWLERAHRQRTQRLAEEEVRNRVIKGILSSALTRWTNRTIDVKNRELQATLDRDAWLISVAFKKWKSVRVRHVEEYSLMESYQFVKREENIRKAFHRWLSAARTSRHRRLTLQRKEAEMKFGVISVSWDKWRDRFKDQRLRPIEYDVILQSDKNVLFRTFAIWHSKTKSLPAIRFNASRIKTRCWKIWLGALPRALQTKTARDVDRKAVLLFLYNSRARYLRLPSAVSRPVNIASRPTPVHTPLVSRSVFPRRAVRTEESSDEEEDEPGPSWRRAQLRTGPRSLRSDPSPPPRSHSRFSSTRSSFGLRLAREVAPSALPRKPASSAGGEPARGRLLHELRQLQRRPKSPSEHSRAREPP